MKSQKETNSKMIKMRNSRRIKMKSIKMTNMKSPRMRNLNEKSSRITKVINMLRKTKVSKMIPNSPPTNQKNLRKRLKKFAKKKRNEGSKKKKNDKIRNQSRR